jgi:hypothetical protein
MLRIHVQSPENRYFVTARLLITIGCNVVMLFIQILEDVQNTIGKCRNKL